MLLDYLIQVKVTMSVTSKGEIWAITVKEVINQYFTWNLSNPVWVRLQYK